MLGAVCVSSVAGLQAKDIRTPGGEKSSISATSTGKKHGDFVMLGRGAKKSIILSNNIFYEPAHDHDAKITEDWQPQHSIRVLKTKDKKRFILLNLSTGKSMKAKILHWS